LSRILRFGGVGLLGFAVDAGLLTWLQHVDIDVYIARTVSFSAAVSVTFLLNRMFTFDASAYPWAGQVAGYGAAQFLGALLNFAVFWLVLIWRPTWTTEPWLPLAIASACSMLVTYWLSKRLLS
jgi:putative flippase GtrA